MQQENKKHKLLERYLNRVKFNDISVGGLIAQYYALNYMSDRYARPIFINFLIFIKYSLTLWNRNKIKPYETDFIFTKQNDRFHFNALIGPLIVHYSNNSTLVSNKDYFDNDQLDIQEIQKRAISFKQTYSNYSKDASKILSTVFSVFYLMLKNRKRLKLSFAEVVYFGGSLLVQIRKASFWDHYFFIMENKPLCLVTEHDRSNKSAPLVLAAKKHKIQTITLIHGVLEDYSFTPFLADYIFCWGESQKSQLIAKCVDPQRIFITGNPIFDHKLQKISCNKIPNKDINICLGISPGFNNRLLIDPLVIALEYFNNVRGILKLHPSFSKEEFKWVETVSSKIKVLTTQDISNRELFENIDLMIINDSGIANEALAAEVPVAVFVPNEIPLLNNFQKELIFQAGCRLVEDEVGLRNIFKDILDNQLSFRNNSVQKSKGYLKYLYNSTGEESVKTMIFEIDLLSKKMIPENSSVLEME